MYHSRVGFDNKTTTCHGGLDPASSSGFEDWILAFARMTEVGRPAASKWVRFVCFHIRLMESVVITSGEPLFRASRAVL